VKAGAHRRRIGPGSGDDFATRVLAERLSVLLGQPFIVENRPGAAA
jgi:tripartite-type tricarboxylate transporter receptor subunit TctC